MEELMVYNSMTAKMERFEPVDPPLVKIYVCGPTVYDDCHVGHARAYVSFDVVRRFLEYSGYRVKYVQNFTDIDDKTIRRAQEQERSYREVAEQYTRNYFRVMDRLNIKRADVYPTVSGHIEEIIEHVEALVEQGMAYASSGDVYFNVKSFPQYGELSGQDMDAMLEGSRVEVQQNKRSPLDFALWKRTAEDSPGWESPWGRGRPGWHIECSVMSRTHLGDTIDIHGGGQDLIFPHHENEVAQSTGLTGEKFVRYWMHNGFVTIADEKMSKSLDNFYTLKELYANFKPEVIRYFILTRQYRSPIDFSFARLAEAREAYNRLKSFYGRLLEAEARSCGCVEADSDLPSASAFKADFIAAFRADFNTAKALGELQKWVKKWNLKFADWRDREYLNRSEQEAVTAARAVFEELTTRLLGLEFADSRSAGLGEPEALIELLIDLRARFRESGDYQLADEIRSGLVETGIELHDSSRGTDWEKLDV